MGHIYKWLGTHEQSKALWQNREALDLYLARLKELMEAEPGSSPRKSEICNMKQQYSNTVVGSLDMGDSIPAVLDPDTIYAIRISEDSDKYGVSFLCPCGCGETVYVTGYLGADRGVTREWGIEIGFGGEVSLSPSVLCSGQTCRSHFFLKANCIVPC